MANQIVTPEIRKQVGMTTEPFTVEIEAGAIRRFAQAIGDPNPLFNDPAKARKTRLGGMIAPPTFGRSLGAAIPSVKLDMPARFLDGGSEWEYFEPIRVGDRITVVSKLQDLRETQGKLGTMVFIVAETSYSNQFGELCVLQRSTIIRY